ncbi:MAG: F0F1 ATP synthase subunit B [Bacillota bacterium]|nr:F0F1 ATP synthase subunit B [Bacillota bacterium]
MRLDYTYIFQILNFIVLFLVLRRYLFGPVKAYLERRERFIRERVLAAEADREHAARLRGEIESEISRAREKARGITDEARRASDQIRAEARKLATEEASLIMARAREEIGRERERALQDIRREAVDLSVAIASQAIHDALDAEGLRRLASRAAREIAGASPGGKVS